MFRFISAAVCAAVLTALPASAGIEITDPYARAASPSAMAGAAFMQITNTGDSADRLVAARSDAAARVELHTHLIDANGVARMVEVAEGFAIAPGETLMLMRGGNHVMLMGLTRPLNQDDTVTVTLVFEQAGEITLDMPVDLNRQPAMSHGAMSHGHMTK